MEKEKDQVKKPKIFSLPPQIIVFQKKKNKLLDKLEKQWDMATEKGAVVRAERIAKRWISVSNRQFKG